MTEPTLIRATEFISLLSCKYDEDVIRVAKNNEGYGQPLPKCIMWFLGNMKTSLSQYKHERAQNVRQVFNLPKILKWQFDKSAPRRIGLRQETCAAQDCLIRFRLIF